MHREDPPRLSRRIRPLLVGLLVAALCWLGARAVGAHAQDAQRTWPEGEGLVWLPPPRAAPVVAMGYRQLWVDVNWARLLVYFGTHQREDASFRFRYLTRFLDNIIALEPKFERVYEWASYAVTYQGGTAEPEEYALSVRYLEQAMQQFPDGYRYFWLAGIRYYMDLESDDPEEQRRLRERGAMLIEQAMQKPDAPANIAELAAGLRTKLGQHERALENLRQVILATEDPKKQEKLIATYRQMAGKEFPEEATRAKAELQRSWMRELPFASPSLYLILGDRPAAAFDLDALAAQPDVVGALLAEPAEPADEPPAGESLDATGSEPPAGATGDTRAPADRGAGATPVP